MNQYIPNAPPPVSTTISIAEVLRGIWQRKGLVAAVTLASFALSLLFVLTAEPRYSTEAQVLIENLETPFDQVQSASANDQRPQIDERAVQSQVSVIGSYDLAQRVIEALKLADRREYDPLKRGIGTVKSILIALGFASDPNQQSQEQRAALKYFDQLNVYVLPNSNVVGIKYTSSDPAAAAEVANALAETYVTSTREAQLVPTGRAKDWLGEQIDDLRKKVVDSEVAAEEFRAKAGLLKGAENTLGSQELSELNSQITQAEAARAEAEARAQSIRQLLRTTGSVDTSSDVLGSALIQRLREQQGAAQRLVDELSVTYLPGHPKLAAARSQLANVNKQIRAEALKIVGGLEEQAKVAAARERSLRDSLAGLKTTAGESNLDDVKLRALEREAAANRTLLESLLSRYSDAAARQDLVAQPGLARIIQKAAVPTSPSFPKTGPIVLLSTLAGLALSLGLAFLVAIMAAADRGTAFAPSAAQPEPGRIDPAPARAPDIETPRPRPQPAAAAAAPPAPPPAPVKPDPAALAQSLAAATARKPASGIPSLPQMAEPVPALFELPGAAEFRAAWHNGASVLAEPQSPYAVSIRQIASWTASLRQTLGHKCVATVSAEFSAVDLCVMTVALARQSASQGARVIVVDATEAPSAFEPMFGTPNDGPGLAELLQGRAEFKDIICKDTGSQAQFLRGGHDRQGASRFIPSERFGLVLDALEGAYDLVLVHGGQVSVKGGSVAQRCDAAVLISSSPGMVEAARALQDLRQGGVGAVQCVRISAPAQQRQPAA
jgi:polysaccharide biosynthesis transport protein